MKLTDFALALIALAALLLFVSGLIRFIEAQATPRFRAPLAEPRVHLR